MVLLKFKGLENLIMKYMLMLLALSITGCSKYDKGQAIADCTFLETKSVVGKVNFDEYYDSTAHSNYIFSCMHSKGYVNNLGLGANLGTGENCITLSTTSSCWNYSWRVFL